MTYHPRPPVPPRAVDDDAVKTIDKLVRFGVKQRAIALQLGIHWRTVSNVWHRRGAYSGVPKFNQGVMK